MTQHPHDDDLRILGHAMKAALDDRLQLPDGVTRGTDAADERHADVAVIVNPHRGQPLVDVAGRSQRPADRDRLDQR